MELRDPKDIHKHEVFSNLFSIGEELLEKIEEDMRKEGYDVSQPIIVRHGMSKGNPFA